MQAPLQEDESSSVATELLHAVEDYTPIVRPRPCAVPRLPAASHACGLVSQIPDEVTNHFLALSGFKCTEYACGQPLPHHIARSRLMCVAANA